MFFLVRFLFLLLFAVADAQLPSTPVTEVLTATITSTVYDTSTVGTVCFILINATDACRRRRNVWIDRPIIVSFDDDSENDLFDGSLQPTQRLQEVTAAPALPSWTANAYTSFVYKNASDEHHSPPIEPSIADATGRSLTNSLKSYYSSITSFIKSFRKNEQKQVIVPIPFDPLRIILKVIVSILTTISTTSTEFVTTTRSIAIQNCIPPGYETVSTCAA